MAIHIFNAIFFNPSKFLNFNFGAIRARENPRIRIYSAKLPKVSICDG
ncbi:MAG: hypothetical protein ACFFDH_11855 [Promethearchaeota archaeon]